MCSRVCGGLLAVTLLYEPSAVWFVPLVTMLGLVAVWLLFWRGRDRSVGPYPPPAERLAMLERVIALRAVSRAAQQARSKGLERVVAGDASLKDVEATTRDLHRHIDAELARAGAVHVDELDARATSYGPGADPWASGREAALYSVILASPWIVLYGRGVVLEPIASDFVGLGTLIALLHVLADWTVYGFLLGYFHPMLPGRTSMAKGLALAVAVVVPWLAYAGVFRVPIGAQSWGSFAAWAVQVTSHLLLLGVVLEYALMRKLRLRGAALVELRDLRPLTTYLSTLVVAIGGVVTTVVSATLTTLLSAGLSIFQPAPPPPDPTGEAKPPEAGSPARESEAVSAGEE